MSQIPYIFTQLTSFIDRDYFELLVKRYKGNAYVKSHTCWNHLSTEKKWLGDLILQYNSDGSPNDGEGIKEPSLFDGLW